jgi:FkbM family methyltransferase
LATVHKSLHYRRPCFVWYQNGHWVHKHPDGYLVERQIMLRPISAFHAMNADYYLHTYRPRPGDTVIDGGASTGWETLLFSNLVGTAGRVIALEPHPASYACLLDMCHRNGLRNVVPIQCAVSDSTGTARLTDLDHHQANTIVATRGEGLVVEARTIDDIVKDQQIQQVNLLKLNIEGAELVALRGAAETLRLTQHVVVSCNDFMATEGWGDVMRTKAEVRRLLERAGFVITEREDDPRPWLREYLYGDRA